jgi:DNA-binding transcriptional MerR regulator
MTIHELAKFTGSSIRTLHYYDRIGLLKPSSIEANGYRKYNEDSLLRMQQIMFFKEMDLPLKEIKDILGQPDFDHKEAIRDQKELLLAKRNRLTRLIEQMDQILEGENALDFSIFEHNELVEVFRSRLMQLDADYQQTIINRYGSLEEFISKMMENEDRVKESAVKYYGSVRNYIEELKKTPPVTREGMGKLQLKLDDTFRRIAAYKETNDVSLPELQGLITEWKSTFSELCQMEDISDMFRNIYHGYAESEEIINAMDQIYGQGSSVFVGKAMEYYDKSTK